MLRYFDNQILVVVKNDKKLHEHRFDDADELLAFDWKKYSYHARVQLLRVGHDIVYSALMSKRTLDIEDMKCFFTGEEGSGTKLL